MCILVLVEHVRPISNDRTEAVDTSTEGADQIWFALLLSGHRTFRVKVVWIDSDCMEF